MAVRRVVIVGGGGAGDAAAFALRKRGFDGMVTIISADHDRPYDRPYLSKEFLRGEVELPKVFLHEESEYAKQGIELQLNRRVIGGSQLAGKLAVDGGGEVEFDALVLGLGGTPRRLPELPRAENVLTLRSLRDSQAIRQALGQTSRLLLIGAGFIGAEVGASARQLGKDVLMVEALPVPLSRALGSEVGEIYARIHRSKGVDVRTGTTVKSWHADGNRVIGVTLSDGRREEADLVLVAVGIEPNLDLPKALGLPIEGGGVRVDEALRAADGVYCGGDIAFHQHPVLGRPIRVEHWEVAKNQGRGIAANIVAGDMPYTKLPYFWSDQYDVNLEYRGQASGDDRAVWRGDRDGLSFSVFYLRDGLIEAVLSINDSKTNELGGKLIESRRRVNESALADMGVDLAELVPASAS
ncbi:MAG TPA: FAD/NAD(P)-binding oxidoreductase [Candidatus Dormibacteraeota bacterium]|jgi:3-phenylpropionate/trans-cinnamate dioxygenase ferredoxin reductase component|nr:FAD/NAD(P)-binding oxidoreductase [Candidatus Dormibacteraeota bacterium]